MSDRLSRSIAGKLGPRLRAARERAGLTPRELALKSRVQLLLVRRIEAAEVLPSLPTLTRLARGLGVDVESFVRDFALLAERCAERPSALVTRRRIA